MACCFSGEPVSQEELEKSPNNSDLAKFYGNTVGNKKYIYKVDFWLVKRF